MKTTLIIGALLTTALVGAQTTEQKEGKKTATVHIKKVENINGVEKVTDTTYTTTDPTMMKFEDVDFDQKGDSRSKQVIIIGNDNGKPMTDEEKKAALDKIMKEMGEVNRAEVERMSEQMAKDHKAGKTCISRTVIVKVELAEPNEAELKKINKENGTTDGELKVDYLNFYPSPANGQSVTLSFELPNKGDTEVSVLNMEGKAVYTEKLTDFTGKYRKTIDISNNAKGIYFVRVEQGKHAQVKKIVLE